MGQERLFTNGPPEAQEVFQKELGKRVALARDESIIHQKQSVLENGMQERFK